MSLFQSSVQYQNSHSFLVKLFKISTCVFYRHDDWTKKLEEDFMNSQEKNMQMKILYMEQPRKTVYENSVMDKEMLTKKLWMKKMIRN